MKTAITGLGCVCALGGNINEVKHALFKTQSARPAPPLGRLESVYTKDYPVFQAPQQILNQKKEDESYGQLFLRLAIEEALTQAGYTKEDLKNYKVGITAGTSVDASFNCFDFYKEWRAGKETSFAPLKHYFETPLSAYLQKFYGVSGPHMTITTACASGTDAVGLGAQWIESGECDIVIACAADEINMIPYTGFIRLMIAGTQPCMPFSNNRKGINLGEGAGVLILESQDLIKQKNKQPQGYVLGYGNSADAYHPTAPDPEGSGLRRALAQVMVQSGLKFENIAFVNAHGTGTPDNDAAEAKVFAYNLPGVPVMATKGYTGHTLGAAGAVEAVLTLLALNERVIPKTNLFEGADPALEGIVPALENTKIDAGKNAAFSDSLAFGGCNSVLALGGAQYDG